MITLITGLPGASKTLWTIGYLKELSARENRPVFYSGIKDVTIEGWTEINPEKWFDAPANSLIFIDECQGIFRPRMNGKEVPKYVSELETHRHKGIDLFMVTQHPMLADSALRRLAGDHRHVVRAFGMEKSVIHRWPSVRDNCDKAASRKDSEKTYWSFDKGLYGLYKSAEVHTVKRSIPLRLKILLLMPVVLGLLGWYLYNSMHNRMHPEAAVAAKSVAAVAGAGAPSSATAASTGKADYKNALVEAKQYVYDHTARVTGLALTAPRYDEVTKPVRAPRPAACAATKSRCSCYTQQATVMSVPDAMCRQIVENGFFQDYDDKDDGRSFQAVKADAYSPGKKADIDRAVPQVAMLVAPAASTGVRSPTTTVESQAQTSQAPVLPQVSPVRIKAQ